jgi:hypothetical protein
VSEDGTRSADQGARLAGYFGTESDESTGRLVGGGTCTGRPFPFEFDRAPGRVGPARAVPRVLTTADGTALVEVKVTDVGAGGRLLAVASAVVS